MITWHSTRERKMDRYERVAAEIDRDIERDIRERTDDEIERVEGVNTVEAPKPVEYTVDTKMNGNGLVAKSRRARLTRRAGKDGPGDASGASGVSGGASGKDGKDGGSDSGSSSAPDNACVRPEVGDEVVKATEVRLASKWAGLKARGVSAKERAAMARLLVSFREGR